MNLKNTLFALSNILDAAESQSRLGGMDPESRAILKFVGASTDAGLEVCIKDVSHNPLLHASPVTLVKRIQSLCESGWLLQGVSDVHHRRVTLQLSAMARTEINSVSTRIDMDLARFLSQKT